jgi:hypothetical protein
MHFLNPPNRLRRGEASKYLRNTWGISRSPATLAKLAVIGGGPGMEYIGRVPFYPLGELDRWAEAQLSPMVHSTSEHKVAAAKQATIAGRGGDHEV